jgi:hypothetical protein
MWALATLFAVTPVPLLATSLRTMRDFPAQPATVTAATMPSIAIPGTRAPGREAT